MIVTREFAAYNKRRFGDPWAAHITNFVGAPTLDFIKGAYNGDDAGGEIVFEAESGEIVKIGQKDYRGSRSYNAFYKVCADGSLEYIPSPIAARKAWQAWKGEGNV